MHSSSEVRARRMTADRATSSESTVSGGADPPAPPRLRGLEAEVLEVVWRRGGASVREVMETLNAGAVNARAYTTYMTIMSRLGAKGLLRRQRAGKSDFYKPVYTRPEYANRRARAELDSMVDQYGEVALAHMARQMAALDPERRRALERIARGK
jgi:BlaI family transcriptional regulator, penicillinase repressor